MVRDGDGEEETETEVLLLKFGDELAKRGEERRLLLEFMEGGILVKITKVLNKERQRWILVTSSSSSSSSQASPSQTQFGWFSVLDASATPIQERVCLTS